MVTIRKRSAKVALVNRYLFNILPSLERLIPSLIFITNIITGNYLGNNEKCAG